MGVRGNQQCRLVQAGPACRKGLGVELGLLCSAGEDFSSVEAVGVRLFGGPASASGLEQ